MKSKLLKYGTVLLACICLFSFICLPVSADGSYEALPITVTKVWTNNVDNNTYVMRDVNYYSIQIPYDSSKTEFASLWTVNNDDTSNYYNYKFKFSFSVIQPTDFTLTFNGVTYEVQKEVVDEYYTYYYVDVHDIKLKNPNARLDFKFSFSGGKSGFVFFQAFYQSSELNAIIDNQNENTDKIIQNQQEQTDKVTNGWAGAEDVDDSAIGDYNSAESDALGGKSDAEIKSEVENALDFDLSFFDSIKIGKINSLFDDTLDALGSSYKALILLSLTLGLSAFLIGRRYS